MVPKNFPFLFLVMFLLTRFYSFDVLGNVVLPVQHKFRGRERRLSEMRAHDIRRHGRVLHSVDMQLGGNADPAKTGLFFTKIGLGTPSKNYYVQLDTGSDNLWVNCAGCENCPKKSKIGIQLSHYDPKDSSTGSMVNCDDNFCLSLYGGPVSGCKPDILCQYNVIYGDGSSTEGYYVRDSVRLDQVTGNLETSSMNDTIVFGCGARQSGELGESDQAVDGIIGFGQANSSMISQLAAAGKVKRSFAHCLDGNGGGGIFVIGDVVQPKVKTTSMIPNMPHYNINLKTVEVDDSVLSLPTDRYDSGDHGGVIIDSGTTLAYLPDDLYEPLMRRIISQQPGLKVHIQQREFSCIYFSGNLDKSFPTVTFHFEDSLSLKVYPHEYLFRNQGDEYCFGWMNSGIQTKDGKELTLLGDLVLTNRLVVYDLENHAIGWTEYNCTSQIKVRDNHGGEFYVGAHDISTASSAAGGPVLTFSVILIVLLFLQNLSCKHC